MLKIFKKFTLFLFVLLLSIVIVGCKEKEDEIPPINTKDYRTEVRQDVDPVVLEELELGFKFFWETANTDLESSGYGLIPDRFNTLTDGIGSMASIASVGYGLGAIPIGIEYGWITKEEGYERALNTLKTLMNMNTTHGFYYHFVNRKTGLRFDNNVEVSVIDTAIAVNGALTVGQYFGGEVLKLAHDIYKRVEWDWYYNKDVNKFYMEYKPETGFAGTWNEYAEQLMVHVLAAGSPTHKVGKEAYTFMKFNSKKADKTNDYDSFYMTWTGSLFVYQFSHAWIDFRNIRDEAGVDWFENSVNASKASLAYAVSRSGDYKTYNEVSWGATACDGPNQYKGEYGFGPNSGGSKNRIVDGTIPPCGAIGSIVFTPEASIAAMKNYRTYDLLWSKYGFVDAYNLGEQEGYDDPSINIGKTGWYATDIIGIDKGISVIMIENYISGFIWNMFMDNQYVQAGLEELGFSEV